MGGMAGAVTLGKEVVESGWYPMDTLVIACAVWEMIQSFSTQFQCLALLPWAAASAGPGTDPATHSTASAPEPHLQQDFPALISKA